MAREKHEMTKNSVTLADTYIFSGKLLRLYKAPAMYDTANFLLRTEQIKVKKQIV